MVDILPNVDGPLDLGLPVQVRDVPAMRVARMSWEGPPSRIGEGFEQVTAFALRHGVGPAGPLMGWYPRLERGVNSIAAQLLVPLTRTVETDDGAIETLRLPRQRTACVMYNGPMNDEFRQMHLDLFGWMDVAGLPRNGTAHQHAYIAGTAASPLWTVEIRVPVVGGSAPASPL